MNPIDYFAMLVSDDNTILLTEAALSLAQDAYPDLDLQEQLDVIDAFASKLKKRIPADAPAVNRLRILNQFYFEELGFAGNINHYHEPDNSYLNRVLETRRGIPISLAIIYMEIGQQIGLSLRGVSFPGHFLVKLKVNSGEIFLDPFNGVSLSKEALEDKLIPYLEDSHVTIPLQQYLSAAGSRDILVRMLRNLKNIYLQSRRWERLLAIQQRLVILLPESVEEKRDRGLAYANLDFFKPAVEDLELYLAARPTAIDAETLREQLPALRQSRKKLG